MRRVKHRTVGAPKGTVARARKLRKEMSLPEVLLWLALKQRPGDSSSESRSGEELR